MRDDSVASELVDLSNTSLGVALSSDDEELAASKRRLLGRIDNPKSSFGGYNPQREERNDEEG